MFKKIFFSLSLVFGMLLMSSSYAGNMSNTRNDLHIIPQSQIKEEDQRAIIQFIWSWAAAGNVLDRYNQKAQELEKKGDIGTSFATGVFGRGTILSYIAYIIQFLSQLGLLIWGIMVVYAGYQYATVIFNYGSANNAKKAIQNAITGILVIIFSYAIYKAILSMFVL